MEEKCRVEIVELHQFFEDWFLGRLPDHDDAFFRVADALAPGFVLISPRGVINKREPLLEGLRRAHGRRSHFSIRIDRVSVRGLGSGLHLATYVEDQETEDGRTARISTVLFRERESSPNGVVWLHVHETWLSP